MGVLFSYIIVNACLAPMSKISRRLEDTSDPLGWSYRLFLAIMWVLEIETGSCERATGDLPTESSLQTMEMVL